MLCASCEPLKDSKLYCTPCWQRAYFYPMMDWRSLQKSLACMVCGWIMKKMPTKNGLAICRDCYKAVYMRWCSLRDRLGLPRKDRSAFRRFLSYASWHNTPLMWKVDVRTIINNRGGRYGLETERLFDYHETRWKPRTPKGSMTCPWCNETKGEFHDVCYACQPLYQSINGYLCKCGNFKVNYHLECQECSDEEFPGVPKAWPFPDILPFPLVKKDRANLFHRLNEPRKLPPQLPDDVLRILNKKGKGRRRLNAQP